MVVLPDVRGLHPSTKSSRSASLRPASTPSPSTTSGARLGWATVAKSFDYTPHVEKTTPEGVSADVAAAIAHLRSKDGGAVRSVFTVGFCFGGSSSWNQSALNPGLNGCIGFYGRPERSLSFLSRMKAPLLLLVAGADFTPQEAFHDFDRKLNEASVPHEMHVYDGAPHSFFDRSFAEWKAACDDAWHRMLAFIKKHS